MAAGVASGRTVEMWGRESSGEGRGGSLHTEGRQALCQELKVRPLCAV